MKQNRILLPFLAICLVACSKDDDEGHSKNEQNVPVKEITFKNCSFTMVKVDGGTFQMGATREQEASGWKPDRTEYPVHKVTLNTFYIGETEVTKELWSAVMETECDYSEYHKPQGVEWNDIQNSGYRPMPNGNMQHGEATDPRDTFIRASTFRSWRPGVTTMPEPIYSMKTSGIIGSYVTMETARIM